MTDIAEDDQWVWMDGSPVKKNCGEYVENHGFHDKKCENDKRYYVYKYSLYHL